MHTHTLAGAYALYSFMWDASLFKSHRQKRLPRRKLRFRTNAGWAFRQV